MAWLSLMSLDPGTMMSRKAYAESKKTLASDGRMSRGSGLHGFTYVTHHLSAR